MKSVKLPGGRDAHICLQELFSVQFHLLLLIFELKLTVEEHRLDLLSCVVFLKKRIFGDLMGWCGKAASMMWREVDVRFALVPSPFHRQERRVQSSCS